MFEQVAIDRITETENLTDNLDDDAAEWLVNWGVSRAKTLIKDMQSADEAADQIDAVMAVMRQLNQIAGVPSDDAAQQAANIEAFVTMYHKAFGVMKPLVAADFQQAAAATSTQTPQEIIQQLLTLVSPAQESHQSE